MSDQWLDPIRTFMREHIGLGVALGATVLVGVRLLVVGELNPVTAMAVLQHAGPANVLVGTMIGVLQPIFVGALLLAFVGTAAESAQTRAISRTACAFFIVTGYFVLYWVWFTTVVIVMTLAWVLRALLRAGLGQRWMPMLERLGGPSRLRSRFYRFTIVLVGSLSLLFVQPWFAPEVIETSDGREFVAFVLRSDSNGAVLLRRDDRQIEFVSEQIRSREVCQADISQFEWRSLHALLVDIKQYPDCPSSPRR